jgi:hypothetical protein
VTEGPGSLGQALSLAIDLESRVTGVAKRLVGRFDIVLARP